MNYDGKTYRNLEGQVAYLTDVLKQLDDRITELAANIPSKMIVEELPETGDPSITYYVGPKGTEPNLYYEVWVWVQEEEEGPFVWRELEDTDQVDLSGYLQKKTDITTNPQAYMKNADGTQANPDVVITPASPYSIVRRNGDGKIICADPTDSAHAATKGYSDSTYVAKMTGTPSYPKAYVLLPNGDQGSIEVNANSTADTIVRRTGGSQINVPYTPTAATNATSKDYVDGNFLAKQSTTSSYAQVYAKATDGTQAMLNANANPTSDSIPIRFAYGHIKLPDQSTYPPTDDDYAISKRYADSHYGSGLVHFIHRIVVDVTTTANYNFKILVSIINSTNTAISSFSDIPTDTDVLSLSVAPLEAEDDEQTPIYWSVSPYYGNGFPYSNTGLGVAISPSSGAPFIISGLNGQGSNVSSISIVDTVSQL